MTRSTLILVPVLALAACTHPGETTRSHGNDMLPSAETTAFQAADARLNWKNARIEYDARECAVYLGTAPDGQLRSEPLLGTNGQPLCPER